MLKAGFILLTIAIAITIYRGASYAADQAFPVARRRKNFKIVTAMVLLLWPVYVGILSSSDFFLDPSLPPRIPLCLVLPCFIMIAFFFLSGFYRNLINVIQLSWLIYFQTFRIALELLLFGLFMEHMLPWSITLEAYNFDIGIGITAPIIGFLVARGRLYRWAVIGWNVLGLLTILALAIIINTYAYRPWLFNETTTMLGKGFGTFPYTYFASCFLPSAVFIHIFAIVKARKLKST